MYGASMGCGSRHALRVASLTARHSVFGGPTTVLIMSVDGVEFAMDRVLFLCITVFAFAIRSAPCASGGPSRFLNPKNGRRFKDQVEVFTDTCFQHVARTDCSALPQYMGMSFHLWQLLILWRLLGPWVVLFGRLCTHPRDTGVDEAMSPPARRTQHLTIDLKSRHEQHRFY